MKKKEMLEKPWFIISYNSLNSKMVGGIRGSRLVTFLLENGIHAKLISSNISEKEESITIKDPLRRESFIARVIGVFLPVDSTLFWVFKVNKYLKKRIPSVILTTASPYGISLVGLLLKKQKTDFFWIADFRDPWTLNVLYRPFFYLYKKWIANYLERKVFEKANLILLNTETDLNDYMVKYPFIKHKSLFVRNGFDTFKANHFSTKNTDVAIKLVYTGSAYQRGVAAKGVIEFMEKINLAFDQTITCDYYGEYHSDLQQPESIVYKDHIQYDEVASVLSEYRMGIVFLQEACLESGRITQKFYDYIGSGVIPIVINPSKEMIFQMDRLNIGIKVFPEDKTQVIAAKIKEQYFSNIAINGAQTKEYTRSNQFEKILRYLKKETEH